MSKKKKIQKFYIPGEPQEIPILRQRQLPAKGENKALPSYPEQYLSANGFGVPMTHPLLLFRTLQDENPWVDLVVRRISQSAAKCTPLFNIESSTRGRKGVIKALERILTFPNTNTPGYVLFLETYEDLVLYGNCYWQIVRDRLGNLHSVYRIPAETIRIEPYFEGNIIKYRYHQLYPMYRVYEHEDIIHFRTTNKKSFIYGKPVFYPNIQNIITDENVSNWVSNFFDQGFAGGVIFKMDADEDSAERNREWLRSEYSGGANAGLPLLLEGELELVSPLTVADIINDYRID